MKGRSWDARELGNAALFFFFNEKSKLKQKEKEERKNIREIGSIARYEIIAYARDYPYR